MIAVIVTVLVVVVLVTLAIEGEVGNGEDAVDDDECGCG